MSDIQFTSVDRVLAKFHRDLRGTDINESDAIEWIGEALGFLKVPQIQEEVVAFLEVENHEVSVPSYFQHVIQIAKHRTWTKTDPCTVTPEIIAHQICPEPPLECNCRSSENFQCDCVGPSCEFPCGGCKCNIPGAVFTDCHGNIIGDHERVYFRPRFDLQWEFNAWQSSTFFRRNFIPVRLSDHSFFNSIVCREHDGDLYRNAYGLEEYTVVGTVQKRLRFSFKSGLIALAYLRQVIDCETGYPLIPDNPSYLAAITYYIKWKIAEWNQWNGREGFKQGLVQDVERLWLKYARQAKNYAKMPKTLDEYQNLMEQTYSLPNLQRYRNFFGNIDLTPRRGVRWLSS